MTINYLTQNRATQNYIRDLLLQVQQHKVSYESLCLKIKSLYEDFQLILTDITTGFDNRLFLQFDDNWFLSVPIECISFLELEGANE